MAQPASDPGPPMGPDPDVRYLPVPVPRAPVEAAPVRAVERALPSPPPAAVAAAGGFLAGVATFVLARLLSRRQGRRSVGRVLSRRRRADGLEVAGSRSFLVDIHLLKR